MTDITVDMLRKRYKEIQNAHVEALAAASVALGRLHECELMLQVIDLPAKEPAQLAAPKLAKKEKSNGKARNKKRHEEGASA